MKTLLIVFLALPIIFLQGCSGCSKSGRREGANRDKTITKINEPSRNGSGKTIIKMKKINGVYQIPVEVNGVEMYFIFDTGASTISISETEAGFLYKQGKLSNEDIVGTQNFSDANGDISEGTIIILRTVQIGDRTLTDVRASVVHNLIAPLLLGQSALEGFGRISIDNNKGEIIFE